MRTPTNRLDPSVHLVRPRRRVARASRIFAATLWAVLFAVPAARAQHLEMTGFGGIRWGGSMDLAGGGSGSFEWAPSYGGSAYWRVREDGLFGVIYSRGKSRFDASVLQPDGTLLPVSADVIVGLVHAGGELETSPTKKLTPILGLSVGATYIQPASGGGDTNWFFSGALTGGGKYRITDHVGLRAQMRLIVTVLDGNSSVVCVSAGGAACAVSASVDALVMGDLVAGLYVEF